MVTTSRRQGRADDDRDHLEAWRADNHGWMFGWKNASAFHAGPSKTMRWFNVNAKDYQGRVKGSVKEAGKHQDDHDSMSGSAVMYDATKSKDPHVRQPAPL